jgi:predicted dinucleotide-binding enzyme
MHTIAILGAGRVGANLADALAAAGHTIVFGVRDLQRTSTNRYGPRVTFTDPATAARTATVAINATPGETSLALFADLAAELSGKLLIDVSNATARDADGLPGGLLYPNSSVAEHLQRALPGTHVVKTLNTMLFTVMTDPRGLTTPPTAFLSGNDPTAKATVTGLLAELGWPLPWIEDLGDITTARGPEAVVLLVPHVIRGRGLKPFALSLAM